MSPGVDSSSEREIAVIGAGIVGMCCACFLQREGFSVCVIDRLAPGEATSFGNAGGIATGEIIPLVGAGPAARRARLAPGSARAARRSLDLCALVSIIAIADLMYQGKLLATQTYRPIETRRGMRR